MPTYEFVCEKCNKTFFFDRECLGIREKEGQVPEMPGSKGEAAHILLSNDNLEEELAIHEA